MIEPGKNQSTEQTTSNFRKEEYCKNLTDVVFGAVCEYCGRSLSFSNNELEKPCKCGDVLWNYQQWHIDYNTCELRRLV